MATITSRIVQFSLGIPKDDCGFFLRYQMSNMDFCASTILLKDMAWSESVCSLSFATLCEIVVHIVLSLRDAFVTASTPSFVICDSKHTIFCHAWCICDSRISAISVYCCKIVRGRSQICILVEHIRKKIVICFYTVQKCVSNLDLLKKM